MSETPSKRQREETQIEDGEETKHHKSYNHIISLLEVEEDEPAEDVSTLITSLEHEILTDSILDFIPCPTTETVQESNPTTASATTAEDCSIATSSSSSSTSSYSKEDEVDDRERVMRHLLEASDDELGIPTMEVAVSSAEYGEAGVNSGDELALCDGLWDLEDEAANYYTLLQSELFM